MGCTELVGSYSGWAESHGYRALDMRQFGKEVKRAFPAAERVRVTVDGRREWVCRGWLMSR